MRNLDGGRIKSVRRQSWLLRPKRKGSLTIPVKVAYFDPANERYRVAKTRKIKIRATAASQGQETASSDERGPLSTDLALHSIRKDIDVTRSQRLGGESLLFNVSLYGSPFLFLCFLGLVQYQRSRSRTAGTRARRSAGRIADRALESIPCSADKLNEGYSALRTAVIEYLSLRLDQSAQGFTHDQIREKLRRQHIEEALVQRVIETLKLLTSLALPVLATKQTFEIQYNMLEALS